MYEEDNDGHTQVIALLKPTPKVSNVELRNFVLHNLYQSRELSLTEAAIHLAAWLRERNFAPEGTEAIDAALREVCYPYEREKRIVTDLEVTERSFLRLARYIRQMHTEGASQHTRVFDYFIPPKAIPRGKSHKGYSHPEHVVPCAFIRDTCLSYFAKDKDYSLDDLVKLIRRLLVIVDIAEEERKTLDIGPFALKDKMPPGWDLETGCIYDRLHKAKPEIKFDHPSGFTCSHTSTPL